jgi:ppGpp synthetase/RelA/SpoT-type nucleotidyltranferase
MKKFNPSPTQKKRIRELVQHYVEHRDNFELVLTQLKGHILGDKELMQHVHSVRWRTKDPKHLQDKLLRRLKERKEHGKSFDITKSNLFSKINDLAAFRILHLYTRQVNDINKALLNRFDKALFPLVEGPTGKTWDDETRKYFNEIKIPTEKKKKHTLYTSVHYVVRANQKSKSTCEVQVRTLSDEVWGEVDHAINYPYQVKSVACYEQIQVLARVTTGCSRLVDSIFKSYEENRHLIGLLRKKRSGG